MVREIRGYPLLEGYRGHPPADIEAIHDVLLRVSRLVEEVPDIASRVSFERASYFLMSASRWVEKYTLPPARVAAYCSRRSPCCASRTSAPAG